MSLHAPMAAMRVGSPPRSAMRWSEDAVETIATEGVEEAQQRFN